MKLVLLWFGGGAPDKLGGRTETCDVMMAKLVRSTPALSKENKAARFNEKSDPQTGDVILLKYFLNFFSTMFVSTTLQREQIMPHKMKERPNSDYILAKQPDFSVYYPKPKPL